MTPGTVVETMRAAALSRSSIDRFACLVRHWAWADAARARFERERSLGWEGDADPFAHRLFGSYYLWCALLCGLFDTALEDDLLSPSQMATLQPDLDACLPILHAGRHILVAVPRTREGDPRIIDLLRGDGALSCLRRVHGRLGAVLLEEQATRSRGLFALDEP
jgi:hypothetical protein